jgi:hypothetical protein
MRDLFEDTVRADSIAAKSVIPLLGGGDRITRRHLNDAMVAALGGTDADGRWSQRDSFKALEHALALYLRSAAYGLTTLADVAAASKIMSRLCLRGVDQLVPSARRRQAHQRVLCRFRASDRA